MKHYYTDQLWKLGGEDVPNAGFLVDQVFSLQEELERESTLENKGFVSVFAFYLLQILPLSNDQSLLKL